MFFVLTCVTLAHQDGLFILNHLFFLVPHFHHLPFEDSLLDNNRISLLRFILLLNENAIDEINGGLLLLLHGWWHGIVGKL